jgi:hypothetical protein
VALAQSPCVPLRLQKTRNQQWVVSEPTHRLHLQQHEVPKERRQLREVDVLLEDGQDAIRVQYAFGGIRERGLRRAAALLD